MGTILLSRKEAASLLKISLPTLQSYTEQGLIKGRYQIGRRVLYKESELLESLSECKIAPYNRG